MPNERAPVADWLWTIEDAVGPPKGFPFVDDTSRKNALRSDVTIFVHSDQSCATAWGDGAKLSREF